MLQSAAATQDQAEADLEGDEESLPQPRSRLELATGMSRFTSYWPRARELQ
jgi:hypothetical protein